MFTLVFLLCTVISASQVKAQETDKGIDSLYGFDPLLYNGPYYTYKIPGNTKGSPLFWDDFEKGSVTIMDRTYPDLDLNFDAFNQLLLLKYVNHKGATNIIEISESWLEKFSIGNSDFELVPRNETRPAICQYIGKGPVKIRYFWKKELKLDNVFGTPVYVYTRPKKVQVLLINQKDFYYRNNKEFRKAFDPSVQMKISNYLKNKKINVKRASDAVMANLVNFCNTQIIP